MRAERHERRLLDGVRAGSSEDLSELFRTHWPSAYRAALLVARDAAAAEDIAQEAFVSALRAIDGFDRRRPFGPWLHRIVVNRAIDWSRARQVRRESPLPSEPGVLEGGEHLADEMGSGLLELSDEVLDAMRALDEERRAVIVMRYLLEYTPGEIAALLELPRGTVNSRLRRALDDLAREMAS